MAERMIQTAELGEEDLLRARFYGLLARLLVAPPSADVLAMIATLEGDDETEMGRALHALAITARHLPPETAELEYQRLFRPGTEAELVPHASYYLTGLMAQEPLLRLHEDLERLGIAPADESGEAADHIGLVCEVMHALITGAFTEPAALPVQRDFFETHLAPWAPQFFRDLEAAPSAALYMPVGAIGRVFLNVESRAFDLSS